MRTYILSHDVRLIPPIMMTVDQIKQTREAEQVVKFLFGIDKLENNIEWGLPVVALWKEYPYALLDYFTTFVEAVKNQVVPNEARRLSELADQCWEHMFTPVKSDYKLENPLLTLATDKMFLSHQVALVATNPIKYCQTYPWITDLSVPFEEDWC